MENIIIDGVEYTPVIKESQIVDKHYHFELHPYDLGEMTWDEAVEAVKKLGNGWRLPTIEECFMIYKDKLINEGDYWSSTEYSATNVYHFYFNYASAFYNGKNFTFTVRGVRDLINK